MTIKLTLVHVDTCLPSYWSGHHAAHIQIPIEPGMSMKSIKQALREELNMGAVMGSDDTSRLLSDVWVGPEHDALATKTTKAAHAAVNRLKPANKGQRRFFTDIEQSDECDESVYAYFVFAEIG